MVSLPSNHFFYFAYGSNLLKKRLRLNNPSAEFIGVGRLNGHQLDFNIYGQRWKGAAATIVPIECDCPSCAKIHVWGAIWRLHREDLPALDEQEGVSTNFYFPKQVTVTTDTNDSLECRTYEQTSVPKPVCGKWELPPERKPSKTYMKCIINGAIECKLPEDYIQQLKLIPDNGIVAPEMESKLF